MNYKQAIEYLDFVYTRGSHPGLSRVTALMNLLDNPQDKINVIHIAGTNGKGSVSAMLCHILSSAGLKTGMFTSPCMGRINDNYTIDGRAVTDDLFAKAVETVKYAESQMSDKPTGFEFEVGLALYIFSKLKCDIVILEAGMGGRLDATNIISSPLLSIITNIGLDHEEFLGGTIDKIASEKSGIIKPCRPIVFGGTNSDAVNTVRKYAKLNSSPLVLVDYSKIADAKYSLGSTKFNWNGSEYELSMLGTYQIKNAAVVMTAIEVLNGCGLSLSESQIRFGLKRARQSGRFELLSSNPPIIYDGAHNPHGMKVCTDSIQAYFGKEKVDVLMGVMADKNYREMLNILCPHIRCAVTVTPNNSRSLSSEALAIEFTKRGSDAKAFADLDSGLRFAVTEARNDNTPLIILGTLYMYNDIIRAINSKGM